MVSFCRCFPQEISFQYYLFLITWQGFGKSEARTGKLFTLCQAVQVSVATGKKCLFVCSFIGCHFVHLFVHSFIFFFIHSFVQHLFLFICLFIHSFIHSSVHLSACPSTHLSVHLVRPFVHPSVCLPARPSIHPSVCLPSRPSIHPSVHSFCAFAMLCFVCDVIQDFYYFSLAYLILYYKQQMLLITDVQRGKKWK